MKMYTIPKARKVDDDGRESCVTQWCHLLEIHV
jgi:hypothetical protein